MGLRFLKLKNGLVRYYRRGGILSVPIPLSLQTALRLQISFLGAFPTTKPEVKL